MNFGQGEVQGASSSNNFQQFVAEQAKAAKNSHVETQRKEQLFSLFNKGPSPQKQAQPQQKPEFKLPFVPNSLSAVKSSHGNETE